ncbi:MAG: adenylate/guanylate cyclase domain-containing protein [Candidatus Sericytochromatia bacterium]|nr:adenylate/guanylate cyclase domain-containing protein [Candidatus Sericytochromatia bacterium]
MDLSAFKRKIETLKQFPQLEAQQVERFGQIVPQLDEWELFRVNPLRFAQTHDIALPVLLDLLIYSVKIGLFDFFWSVICPACGGVEYTYDSINRLKQSDVYCTTCNLSVSCDLDEQVEVSFTLNPAIHDLSQQVNPFAGMDYYLRYFFSANYLRSPDLQAFAKSHFLGFDVIEPDQSLNLTLQAEPGQHYRLINLQSHSQLALYANTEPNARTHVETDLLSKGFAQEALNISAGELQLTVHNRNNQPMIVTSWKADFQRLRQILNESPHTRTPFYTGKMLLSNQTFREQFRIQQLDQDLKLNIRSLTLLFTDLKGSTEMYEQAGDYQAYSLVQQHFNVLAGCVRRNAGSIVKTMGDAIMATFTSPLDGARAAQEMLAAVASLPESEHKLGLKIGLHEGPVLAVNADERLDYFGQTVNLAARVQGLAEAGEIWLTETVYQDLQGNCPLHQAGFDSEAQSARLKGVSALTPVYRFFKPSPAL